jgi:hypothetical protein
MDLTLIPFALRKADDQIVDVAEVEQGLACGCICPSCQSPLIARKGDIKTWHFAHVSRADEGDTRTDCGYSWAVSVRLMARQLLREGMLLDLPPFEDIVEITLGAGRPIRHSYEVAPPQTLNLPPSEIDSKFGGVLVDALGRSEDGAFAIYITHSNRSAPDDLSAAPAPCAGVIVIDLMALASQNHESTERQNYRQLLSTFLSADLPSKRWMFHPHAVNRRQRELEALRRRREEHPTFASTSTIYPAHRSPSPPPSVASKTLPYRSIPAVPGDPLRYHCVNCDFRWGDLTGGKEPCPQCRHRWMVVVIR